MANNINSNGKQSYASWEEGVADSLSDKLEISYSDAQGIIESNEFYMAQAWAKGMDSKKTADFIDSKSTSMAKGGSLKNSNLNVTNEMRGEGSDDYGTFEIYKNGGQIEVKVVNSDKEYSEKEYDWILGDKDNDGVANADDIKPLDKNRKERIDEPTITTGIKNLISLKKSLDSTMYSFIDELKDIAPNKSKIYARTKTPYSVLDKLIKKRLSTITDLIGTTIVTNDKKELDKVKRYVESGKMGKVIELEDMYEKPKGGYRAYHFLIERNGMSVELQLKTKRQKAINELSHEPYKLGKINSQLLLKITEIGNRADEGDKDAIKEYNEFISQPNIEKVFYAERGGYMAKGGGIREYEIYHKTLASALEEVEEWASRNGYTFTSEHYFPDVTSGGVKYGETKRFKREVKKDGRNKEGDIAIQVYRMDSGTYELNLYPTFKRGGSIEDENLDMVKSQNKAISHHTKELQSQLNMGKDAPAWVVSKVSRASNDLSDVTHYLDGEKMVKGGNIDEWDEEQYPSRREMLESILTKEFGNMNQYSGSADWGGIPVWSLSGDDFEGAFIGIGDDDGLFIVEREQDYEVGDTKETEIMTASYYDDFSKMKRLIAKAKTMQGKMADGGVIKGSNNKTGERFGVVIGSETISDEYIENGLELNVRKVYGSRTSESKLIFDEKGNLHGIVDYGSSLEGNPHLGIGYGHGTHYGADKKKTIQILSEMYTPSFAKNLVQSVYTKMAKGGKVEKNRYKIFIYFGGDMNDKIVYADTIEQAKKLSQQGEHSEIIDTNTNQLIELYANGGGIETTNEDRYNCYTTGYDGRKNTYGNENDLTLEDAIDFCWRFDDVRRNFSTKEDLEKKIKSTPYGKDRVIASSGNITGVVVYKLVPEKKPIVNNGGSDNEVLSFFKNLDYSKLPPAFAEYIKNEVLTDADLQYLSPKEPIFLEIKKKVEDYTNKGASKPASKTATKPDTGDSDEKKKVLQEIADLEGIKDLVSGDELNKINKELDDLNGLLPIL